MPIAKTNTVIPDRCLPQRSGISRVLGQDFGKILLDGWRAPRSVRSWAEEALQHG